MEKAELFLQKYKELEAAVRVAYGRDDDRSPVLFLSRRPEFSRIRTELDTCRELRNLLTHNPPFRGEYCAAPGDGLIEFLDEAIRAVTSPPTAGDAAVPRGRLLCRGADDRVVDTLRRMREYFYSYVPILEDGVVRGVFGESTLISFFLDGGRIDGETRFSDISRYIGLDADRQESFRFASPGTRLSEIEDAFDKAKKRGDRLGMVFVTEHGSRDEPVEGILTAWDVIKNEI